MRPVKRFISWILLTACLAGTAQAAEWSHIEYGAANVASGVKVVQAGERLELTLLRNTLDTFVLQKGPKGLFYVNDLHPEMTARTGNALRAYATQKGWMDVEIRVLPGDYFQIELPYTDTAHLMNPPGELFQGNPHLAEHLQHLADHSREGLYLVTSQRLFENFAAAYQNITRLGDGEPYVDPTGRQVAKPTSRYQIAPLAGFPTERQPAKGQTCPILLHQIWERHKLN
jgi:hypothetical protein